MLIQRTFIFSYWTRVPTGKEYVVQNVLGINHGGLGSLAWNDPTTDDIKASASVLAKSLATMKDFILSPTASFRGVVKNRVDVGLWTVGTQTLLLATNLNYANATLELAAAGFGAVREVTQVLDSGATLSKGVISFESVGTGGFILS